jgi:hypothetical protein
MTINSEINTDLNIIIRTVIGKLEGADITSAFSESLSHPDFKINMHVIWDLTKADISNASAEQIIQVVEYIGNAIEDRGADYKLVIVAPVDLSFGISRIFGSYGYNFPVSIHIVRNMDEAYDLIGGR